MNQPTTIQAFAARSIAESVVGFAQFLRSHGFNTGIQETQDALNAANEGLLSERKFMHHGLKALFCHSPEERLVFDKLFLLYWDTNPMDLSERKNVTNIRGVVEVKSNPTLVMLGQGKTSHEAEEAKSVTGAHEMERIKQTDLSKIGDIDPALFESIAQRLFKQMALRLRRRMKNARSGGQLNLRRTIRHSIAFGGEPIELFRKAQKPKKQRLIVLLDVSGSMDKYSFYLLRFICVLKSYFRQLEAFVFSTSLIRISKALKLSRLDDALSIIGEQATHWSSGTKIGECLEGFMDKYGKQLLNGSPTIIILSDGLDTGDKGVLGKAMANMHKRSRRIIWLNPLKGMKGYAPEARGMREALPSVDEFRSAHNLSSLLELENILANA